MAVTCARQGVAESTVANTDAPKGLPFMQPVDVNEARSTDDLAGDRRCELENGCKQIRQKNTAKSDPSPDGPPKSNVVEPD